VSAYASAGAGFLLAVLWFDLIFDVQILGHRGEGMPEEVLGSICAYYARVTTAARPMNRRDLAGRHPHRAERRAAGHASGPP
jgi:hypothetical protein